MLLFLENIVFLFKHVKQIQDNMVILSDPKEYEYSVFFIILFQGLLKQWSYAPDDSDLQGTLGFYIQFPFEGGDKRFDRMMKEHRALKTFLDLWDVGSGGGQRPSSEVHPAP